MSKDREPRWCIWPNPDYARAAEELYQAGLRCDLWREFFRTETGAALERLGAQSIWFNRYEYFDKVGCTLKCSEHNAQAGLRALMRPGHECPVEFKRIDIYEPRGWCVLPLDCFVDTSAANFQPRAGIGQHWQHEVLEKNEMPVLQCGVLKSWTVSRDCFTLKHRVKFGIRHAEMTFAHPDLDSRFGNKRWVADGEFKAGATRADMTAALFLEVERRCRENLVTLVEPEG